MRMLHEVIPEWHANPEFFRKETLMHRIAVYMATVFLGSMALSGETCLNWSNESITDDVIADGMRRGPASVRYTINLLKKRHKQGKLENLAVLNLSQNNIGLEGATQFFHYISKEIPHLKELHLSFNPIRIDWYSDATQVKEFKDALKELLQNPNFDSIFLQETFIAEEYQKTIVQPLAADLVKKIHW